MHLVVVIPAFNEAKTIGKVIRDIPVKLPGMRQLTIIVIDDGSHDGTSRIAKNSGVIVLRHLLNRGKGVGVSTGFQAAKRMGADVVVTLDADGQHDPAEIPTLIAPIVQDGADLVIGSRLLAPAGQMPTDRLLNNKLSNIFTRLLAGVTVTDSQSGYRAFSKRAMEKITVESYGFEVETEVLVQARRHRLQIQEVPIKTIYTPYSRSKGQRFAHGITMAFQMVLKTIRGYR